MSSHSGIRNTQLKFNSVSNSASPNFELGSHLHFTSNVQIALSYFPTNVRLICVRLENIQ